MSAIKKTRCQRTSRKVGAVLALLQTGVTQYATLAKATGLSVDDVQQVCADRDAHALEDSAAHVYYHLRCNITCPVCGGHIYLVPCVACTMARHRQWAGSRRLAPVRPALTRQLDLEHRPSAI